MKTEEKNALMEKMFGDLIKIAEDAIDAGAGHIECIKANVYDAAWKKVCEKVALVKSV